MLNVLGVLQNSNNNTTGKNGTFRSQPANISFHPEAAPEMSKVNPLPTQEAKLLKGHSGTVLTVRFNGMFGARRVLSNCVQLKAITVLVAGKTKLLDYGTHTKVYV